MIFNWLLDMGMGINMDIDMGMVSIAISIVIGNNRLLQISNKLKFNAAYYKFLGSLIMKERFYFIKTVL